MFRNREDAAKQLAARLKERKFKDPVVLGIPRGGVVPATILAEALSAEIDILLTRKIRAPNQPELAIGAVGEDGEIYLYHPEMADQAYLSHEQQHQVEEIRRRRELVKGVLEPVPLKDRSVVVTDDGIATGSTLIAGLHRVRQQDPFEVIVAVPVAPPDALKRLRQYCDGIICLYSPSNFWAIGQFYTDFSQISDAKMLEILRDFKRQRSLRNEVRI